MNFLKDIELKKAFLHLVEEGFIVLIFKDNVEFEVDDVVEVNNVTHELVKGKPFVILYDVRNVRSNFPTEVREQFAHDEKIKDIRKGQAIVTESLHNRILANFYMKFHKPTNPIRLFKDYDKAFKWIKSIKEGKTNHWYKALFHQTIMISLTKFFRC